MAVRYDLAAVQATVYDTWRGRMIPTLQRVRAARAALPDMVLPLSRAWIRRPRCGRLYLAHLMEYAHGSTPRYDPCYHIRLPAIPQVKVPAALRPPLELPVPPAPEDVAVHAAALLGRPERLVREDGLTAGELARVGKAAAKNADAAGRWIGTRLPEREIAARGARMMREHGFACGPCDGTRYCADS